MTDCYSYLFITSMEPMKFVDMRNKKQWDYSHTVHWNFKSKFTITVLSHPCFYTQGIYPWVHRLISVMILLVRSILRRITM